MKLYHSLKNFGRVTIMFTSNNERTSKASKSAILKVISYALPQQREEVIAKLKSDGSIVAMVGDGINDATTRTRAF